MKRKTKLAAIPSLDSTPNLVEERLHEAQVGKRRVKVVRRGMHAGFNCI